MPLITISAGVPTTDAGTYEMILMSIVPKVITKRETGEQVNVLEWTFGDVEDDSIEINALSSIVFTPKSKTVAWITALLGPDAAKIGAAFDEKDLVGRKAMITVAVEESGYSKVINVSPMPTRRVSRRDTAEIAAAVREEPTEGAQDDLPF